MNIQEYIEKIKGAPDIPRDIFIVMVILLTGICSFALGKISGIDGRRGDDLRLEMLSTSSMAALTVDGIAGEGGDEVLGNPKPVVMENNAQQVLGMYVGSKSGKSYHLPWCSGAKRIKTENQVWFQSKEDAESRGYRPAGNCPGI